MISDKANCTSTYLASLHGGEGNVSKELGAGRRGEVKRSSVEVSVLISDHVGVDLLEDFIESKLAETLGGVSDSSGGPAKDKSLGSSLSKGHFEAIANRLVLLLVDLQPALDQVEGGDGCVGHATGENSTKGAESEVFLGSELTAVLLRSGRHQVSITSL